MRAKSVLMTDGYAVYDQIAQAHQLVHLACWAHCRRDFNDALLEQRQLHSVPVLQRIEALLLANIHAVQPGSLLGKALHCMSGQWSKLSLYVTRGEYPIDNNACENSIRPFVIGRKNWLFSDTVAGGNASAKLYSLMQTCAVNGVDGYKYLRALLVALPAAQTADDYEALLPWSIALQAD